MQNLLHNLNPEQLAAVTLPGQSALILAGAGSGKTRVLITRIAWLIQTGQISPMGVLAVTFTNKAAKEMMTRLSSMLPINTRSMWIGTFHGVCNRLLRMHYLDAGLPQTFQILDTQDQLAMIKRLLKTLNVDDEKYPPKNLMYFINGAKEQGLRANEVEVHDDFSRRMVELYAAYDQQCQHDGVLDFAELLLRCYELLSRNQALRQHYQARFKHILVDEFQDTNNLQYRWLKLLAGKDTPEPSAVFAVGDDDQSIYAFRGANVGNMSAFEHDFQVQNLIKLEQNYRSHGHILDCANQLIAHNSKRLGKNLHTDAGYGELLRIYEASSDLQEARWIVEEARNLIAEGIVRSEIAVLYRSNAQSRAIEHALFSAGVPYHVYGGQRYFQRAEIKHALAYLQLIDNPHNDLAFLRVVNFPVRGIGMRSIEQLQDMAQQQGVSLYTAIAYMTGRVASAMGVFLQLIESARAQTQHLPLPEMVEVMLGMSGLLTHYQHEKEGADRIENLQQLVSAAVQFVSEEGYGKSAPALLGPKLGSDVAGIIPVEAEVNNANTEILDADAPLQAVMSPLSAFLSHASLEAGDHQAVAGQEALQLMTVHAAKGLEFDAVFITGLEEGLFPHENSSNGSNNNHSREEDGVEEERRLMYVAITRAKKRLYLSFAQTRMLHGQTRYNVKSRFLNELPEASLKWLSPKTQPQWSASYQKSAWDDEGVTLGANAKALSFNQKEIGWRIGETAFHQKFGEGVIVNIEGSGGNLRAQINFGRHGMKLLDLNIAKLTKTA